MKTNKLLSFFLIIAVSFSSYGQNPFTEMLNDPATRAIIDSDIPTRDQVILDDLIVDGSACVGQDCVNGESFGFDTFRMKENNLRMHFQDTSSSASFPTNDWRFIFNDSSNGGANYFAVEDSNAGRQVFRVEAGAPSNALYVESDGDVGLGTNNPVVELHVKDGDTPTMRLEQDGSSGFGPQTWDVAGNETNFFVRDATNGSKLPFKIRPDSPTSSIDIKPDGVYLGENSNSSQGLVLNRMTTATRTGLTATEGKLVYDTDLDQTFVGDGAGWIPGGASFSAFFSTFNNSLFLVYGGESTTIDLSSLANPAPLTGDDDLIETRTKIETLQNQVDDLMARMEAMESCGCYNEVAGDEGRAVVGDNANVATNQAYLSQNIPNPFDNTTNISYFVPFVNSSANIVISNATGQILENRSIDKFGQGSIVVSKSRMSTGIYFYTLYADGKKIDTKRMVVE
jgi:hypothetical protein